MPSITPLVHANGFVDDEDITVSSLMKAVKLALPSQGSSQKYDRKRLKDAAHRLSLALETPGETVQRVAYISLQSAIVRIANRLNLLQAIVDAPSPQSSKELAATVGTDPTLLQRFLRFLVASDMVGEPDVDRYNATNITRNLAIPALAAGVNCFYSTVGPASMALDQFFQETNYQNPEDSKNCPFQMGLNTEDSFFQWLSKQPEKLTDFNMWMTGQREGRVGWLDYFPVEEKLLNGFKGGDNSVMFIDVGGAKGHEIANIKKKFPDLPGKFILQELPDSVKQAVQAPGMEAMAYDFFEKQPVTGAKTYYLRNVLHDWPDKACNSILMNIVEAMTPGYSNLIVNEMVVPDKGAGLVAAQRDMTMMSLCAAMERTESMWRNMLGKVGLRIEKIWSGEEGSESIIVAVKD